MRYELALASYRGPLDKLLELVLEKKLEITEVSLAEVTADFLKYLEKLEKARADPALITDFLVVASKLVLIKSKNLLPSLEFSEEEETDIRAFEERLKIYAEFKNAQKLIKEKWSILPQMMAREFLMAGAPAFYPPKKITKKELYLALAKVLGEFEKIFKPAKAIKIKIINLKEKIEEILKELTAKPVGFNELRSKKKRSEVVVIFLAILHLIKDQLVYVEQNRHFGEIKIAKKPKSG